MRSPAERFNRARQQMDTARQELETFLGELDRALWTRSPAHGRWSVSQVVQHLARVEARVLERLERALQTEALPGPDWRRFFHWPVSWVEWRGVRVKTFAPYDPAEALSSEQCLSELGAVRQRLCARLEPHRATDLRGLCARHPFLGFLDGYAWMAYLGAHDRRHLQQIAEVVAAVVSRSACRSAPSRHAR